MRAFEVPVRNEFTGEVRVVSVSSTYVVDAQLQALHRLFEREGWRRATAALPLPQRVEAGA